jgi:hypothetical protein
LCAGDDTVVVSFADWRSAAGIPGTSVLMVRLRSSWTVMRGTGVDRCHGGASNLEQFRVRRRGGVWAAVRVPGAIHGVAECIPVP